MDKLNRFTKGSLRSDVEGFRRAGLRRLFPAVPIFPIDDREIEPVLKEPRRCPLRLHVVLDCGITGADWILENDSHVVSLADLVYAKQSSAKVRWVLAVPETSTIKSVKDLEGKRVATELVSVTKKYLKKNKISADVEFSWGATEAKVVTGLVDAIVELTETGSSLKAHNLRIVSTICESTTQFIANKQAVKSAWKTSKMDQIVMLLQGAIAADGMVG